MLSKRNCIGNGEKMHISLILNGKLQIEMLKYHQQRNPNLMLPQIGATQNESQNVHVQKILQKNMLFAKRKVLFG